MVQQPLVNYMVTLYRCRECKICEQLLAYLRLWLSHMIQYITVQCNTLVLDGTQVVLCHTPQGLVYFPIMIDQPLVMQKVYMLAHLWVLSCKC